LLKAVPLKAPACTAATKFCTVTGATLPYKPAAGGSAAATAAAAAGADEHCQARMAGVWWMRLLPSCACTSPAAIPAFAPTSANRLSSEPAQHQLAAQTVLAAAAVALIPPRLLLLLLEHTPMTILPAGSASVGSTVLSPSVRSPGALKADDATPTSKYICKCKHKPICSYSILLTDQLFGTTEHYRCQWRITL
jgi:hypothetical protein